MARSLPIKADEFMDSSVCLCLLEDLYANRYSTPWPVLSANLTSIVLAATTDMDTWKREKSVTKQAAESMLRSTMRITHQICTKVCSDDIENVEFIPSNVLSEMRICKNFVRLCYRAFVHNEAENGVLPFDLAYNDNVAKITAKMTVKSTFEKRPKSDANESLLWTKLTNVGSSRDLFTATSVWTCRGGCEKYLEEEGNFAIVDKCNHMFCIDCAKKNFDVPGYQKSRCPECHSDVTAWTDNRNFKIFKAPEVMKQMRQIVKTVVRNINSYGFNEYR